MWALERPVRSAESAFSICISHVSDAHLRGRLLAATPAIVAASDQLDRLATMGQIHDIRSHKIFGSDVTTDEMSKVYSQRMVKTGSPGRPIYDEIFSSSPGGRCPLCTHRLVATLDHHLPKAHFPSLAVAPLNLIPACSDCNKMKSDKVPATPEDVPLNPYFDDLGAGIWLRAKVVESRPAALRFGIVRPPGWCDVLAARVINHFRSLRLAVLFASEAAEELINIRHQLAIIKESESEGGVRAELQSRAASSAVERPNGWRTAAYRAWSESDWFCAGGFARPHE